VRGWGAAPSSPQPLGASFGPRHPEGRQDFGALYVFERDDRKGRELLMSRARESSPVAISSSGSPPKSTSCSRNASASHMESSPGSEYGVRPTHARGRALADSQDQRRLSTATASHLVRSLERTLDVVCAELGKPNAEMPSRRTELGYNISSSARAVLLPLAGPHPRPHSIQAVLLPLAGPHPRPHLSF
jgi:hypothetical protein